MPPKKKKDEEVDGYTRALNYARTGLVTARMAIVAVMAPSVHAYFWWCFVIYLICAVIILAERSPIQDFFCTLPPQDEVDGQDFGGQGCENCPSTLLMCEVGTPCYKAVMNITYQGYASEPKMQFHQDFLQASTDLVCNNIILSAFSPLDALKHIFRNMDDVNTGCIKYHCRVLKEALTNPDLINLEGGTCSNTWGTKGWGGTMTGAADDCVCQTLVTDPDEINEEIKTAVDGLCPNALDSMCDPMFYSYHFHWCDDEPTPALAPPVSAPTMAPASPTAPPAPAPDPTMAPAPTMPCSAGGGMCGFNSVAVTACCTGTCNDVGGGQMYCLGGAAPPGECSAGGQICGINSVASYTCCTGTCRDAGSLMYCLDLNRRLEEGGGNCGGAGVSADCQRPATAEASHHEASELVERRLQNLPDYTVTDWSECTCYQQCIPGIRQRTVDCLAAACQDPAPPSKESCVCDHCARCMIDTHLIVLEIMFFVQAGLAFLAFLCYLYINTMKEDQLVKLSWARWSMGIICKRFPPMVKYLVLSTAITMVLMWCRIWAPQILSTNRDMECWRSTALKTCTAVLMAMWFTQLWLTHQAKKFTRRPPWLYSPERGDWPSFLKTVVRFVRLLGP